MPPVETVPGGGHAYGANTCSESRFKRPPSPGAEAQDGCGGREKRPRTELPPATPSQAHRPVPLLPASTVSRGTVLPSEASVDLDTAGSRDGASNDEDVGVLELFEKAMLDRDCDAIRQMFEDHHKRTILLNHRVRLYDALLTDLTNHGGEALSECFAEVTRHLNEESDPGRPNDNSGPLRCREKPFNELVDLVEASLTDGSSKLVYVCGNPGLGKTQTVIRVRDALTGFVEVAYFNFRNEGDNCDKRNPYLESIRDSKPEDGFRVIILDELPVGMLDSKYRRQILEVFDLSRTSHMVIICVGNTMNFDKIIKEREYLKEKVKMLVFEPYSAEDLLRIFEKPAAMHKVSWLRLIKMFSGNTNGDLRKFGDLRDRLREKVIKNEIKDVSKQSHLVWREVLGGGENVMRCLNEQQLTFVYKFLDGVQMKMEKNEETYVVKPESLKNHPRLEILLGKLHDFAEILSKHRILSIEEDGQIRLHHRRVTLLRLIEELKDNNN